MKIIYIIFIILMSTLVIADYQSDEDMNMLGNDIYNATNITSVYLTGDGRYITNIDASNVEDIWLNATGDTWQGDMNAGGNELTDVGSLIMSGIITSKNIIPDTTDLYSLGNSTHWYDVAYIRTIFTDDIHATNINVTDVDAVNIDSDTLNVENNMTVGDIIIKEENTNYVVILT